jgi:hypothetical protein
MAEKEMHMPATSQPVKYVHFSDKMTEKVLPGVEAGLTSADMVKLKASTGDVQKLTKFLQALLPATAK